MRLPRWFIRYVLPAVACLALFAAWRVVREPPEIQKSLPLRIGMTQPEVEAVMGRTEVLTYVAPGNEQGMLCGSSTRFRFVWSSRICSWIGISAPDVRRYEWPVRIHLDSAGRVDRIQRGNDIEAAALTTQR
ncbi:MAG: hypothetical protein JNG89_19700 [Planctomycetaceae bacterium]|nr:hypothetical protein [Planctomycetaceae bacterium]